MEERTLLNILVVDDNSDYPKHLAATFAMEAKKRNIDITMFFVTPQFVPLTQVNTEISVHYVFMTPEYTPDRSAFLNRALEVLGDETLTIHFASIDGNLGDKGENIPENEKVYSGPIIDLCILENIPFNILSGSSKESVNKIIRNLKYPNKVESSYIHFKDTIDIFGYTKQGVERAIECYNNIEHNNELREDEGNELKNF